MTDAAAPRQLSPQAVLVAWVFLLAFETMAQVGLKAGGEVLSGVPFGMAWLGQAAQTPWVWAGIVGYLGGFASWMVILDRMPLSLGFPLTAVVMLTVALASRYIFGEELSSWRLSGIGLVIIGMAIMGGDDS